MLASSQIQDSFMEGDRDPKLPPPISFTQSAFSSKPGYETSNSTTQKADGRRHPRVMSLSACCIKALSLIEIHNLPDLETCWTRRSYDSATMKKAVLDLLPFIPKPLLGIPERKKLEKKAPKKSVACSTLDTSEDTSTGHYIGMIHPQLWGLLNALIIPSTLPPILRHLSLPLIDEHVPSLQTSRILCTPTLSLLTHVSFSSTESRSKITDDSLLQLRTLSCLTVLNLAGTPVKSSGILRLLASMRAMLPSKASPWRLRVLDLRRTFVDDEVLMGNKTGLSLKVFPLLCVIGESKFKLCGMQTYPRIDLRDTSVTSMACKAFQRLWGTSSHVPPELFHPTPARCLMDCISGLINKGGSTQAIPTVDHAILLLEEGPPTQQKDTSLRMKQEGIRKNDQLLRTHTSGVIVLTATDMILGNVLEVAGGTEEGSAQASFKRNQASTEYLYNKRRSDGEDSFDPRPQRLERYPEYDQETPYYDDYVCSDDASQYQSEDFLGSDDASQQDIDDETSHDEDDFDSGEEPSQDPHEMAEDKRREEIQLGLMMYRDPPDPGVLSQVAAPLPTQGVKRPRTNNETFSVKRFKGPVMSQIFGTKASSISSRHL